MWFERRLLLATLFLASQACSSSQDNCPGQCPADSVSPSMTIETSDGVASIAKAKVVSGPCSHLLIRSAGEAGVEMGYAAVQVTYHGSTTIPPLCLVEVTALTGESTVVTTSVTATNYTQPCCPYGSCCLKSNETALHYHVEFDQPTQTVTFAPGIDGGVPDVAVDAAEADAGEQALDAGDGVDEGDIDGAPARDGASIDSAPRVDAEMDVAQDVAALPLDATPALDGAVDL
jgi:hypothetical protein